MDMKEMCEKEMVEELTNIEILVTELIQKSVKLKYELSKRRLEPILD